MRILAGSFVAISGGFPQQHEQWRLPELIDGSGDGMAVGSLIFSLKSSSRTKYSSLSNEEVRKVRNVPVRFNGHEHT